MESEKNQISKDFDMPILSLALSLSMIKLYDSIPHHTPIEKTICGVSIKKRQRHD